MSVKKEDSNSTEPGDQSIRETDPVTSKPSATSDPTTDRARTIVADMTNDEKLWCLDGDAPFWSGLTYLSEQGYHKSPFRAARVDRLGLPGFAFSDGPRGVVVDHATCFPVSMARGPPGISTSRSGSVMPSGLSSARWGPISMEVCVSTCYVIRPGVGPRKPTARIRTTSAKWERPSRGGCSGTPWPA